jgi:putative endonuclease
MDKSSIGKKGEDFCEEYYRKRGYEILRRNYHSRYGEIDLIAKKDNTVVFIEVKTRGEKTVASPRESVTKTKQKKLVLTSMQYMENQPLNLSCRFDVFEVWQNDGRIYKFNCIEAAFDAEDFSGRYDIY